MLRGNWFRRPEPDTLALPFGARALTIHAPNLDCKTAAESEKEEPYSRKPGFTDTRLRPLARRREITARPALVFIRVRNPCVFER